MRDWERDAGQDPVELAAPLIGHLAEPTTDILAATLLMMD
jgi:hypothetical protein